MNENKKALAIGDLPALFYDNNKHYLQIAWAPANNNANYVIKMIHILD